MKELREKQETAERILRLVEMCRKLETERERVMPAVDLAAMSELDQLSESAQVQQLRAANEPELLRETAGEQLPYHPQTCLPDGTPAPLRTALDNLYRRFNKAHLDTMALEREYDNLQQENTVRAPPRGDRACVLLCSHASAARASVRRSCAPS